MATLPSAEAISTREIRAHVDRILNSEALRRAPNLCHLLEYVVTKWAEGNSHHIKESVLAIEVFGRRADFDGRIDNIVRVQAHRLRKVLETYYAEEGRAEALRLCIPRGSYVPHVVFADQVEAPSLSQVSVLTPVHGPVSPVMVAVLASSMADSPAAVATDSISGQAPEMTEHEAPPKEVKHPLRKSRWSFLRTYLSYAIVFAAGALLAGLVMLRSTTLPGLSDHLRPLGSDMQVSPSPALAEIWKGIFEPDVKTIIAFTSPSFLRVGRSQAYLLYHGPLSAPEGTEMMAAERDPHVDKQFLPKGEKLYFNNGWTGTGEVLAVNRLSTLAAQFRQAPNVIPSRVLSMNEARASNVIFIGAPIMNGMIAKIGTESAPVYITEDSRILLRQPVPGEPAVYQNIADPATGQMKTCYALFSVLPGVDDSRKIVSSAGIGSWATWGAIEFLTKPNGAAQLADSLKAANGGQLPRYYQAVIRSEIIDGSVANQALMSIRVVKP
jgi:hypothetical protein